MWACVHLSMPPKKLSCQKELYADDLSDSQ
jgi:hypothetical protein